MKLTDADIRSKIKAIAAGNPITLEDGKRVVPVGETIRLSDGGGLELRIRKGKKGVTAKWTFRYTFAGADRTLPLGGYPVGTKPRQGELTVGAARDARTKKQALLIDGQDPYIERQQTEASHDQARRNTFGAVAEQYLKDSMRRVDKEHLPNIKRNIGYLSPLHNRYINSIKHKEILELCRSIRDEKNIHNTAKRVAQTAGAIFKFHNGPDGDNPARGVSEALGKAPSKSMAHIKNVALFGKLLAAINSYDKCYHPSMAAALRLSPYLALRPNELTGLEWSEVDLEGKRLYIPASRMKMGRDHIVPLGPTALKILESQQIVTGDKKHVFHHRKGKPITIGGLSDTLNAAMTEAGLDPTLQTNHGYRHCFRTFCRGQLGFDREHLEFQLAHASTDTYDSNDFLEQRTIIMNAYDAWLNERRSIARSENVVPIGQATKTKSA